MVFAVTACDTPHGFQVGLPNDDANVRRIYIATQRTAEDVRFSGERGEMNFFGDDRHREMNYAVIDVSIPPTHQLGEIEWPSDPIAQPNTATDFAIIQGSHIDDAKDFRTQIAAEPSGESGDVVVFVHGFNTTVPEAAYRLAQISNDFEMEWPTVLFSWPSAGRANGYVYDRDSVLFARDDLVALLENLAHTRDQDIFIIAHSMGTHLAMEALRQIAISENHDLLSRIDGVTLMSPDIDPDVFRRQAQAIGTLPDPFFIFVTQQDRALHISSLLTGGRERIGDIKGPEDVVGLDVNVIDFTNLANGRNLDHLVAVTSPDAIRVLRNMMNPDEVNETGFADFLVLSGDEY